MFLPILFLQQQLISFDFEVGPITGAVRKLSQVSGVKLSVEGSAADETVFLHVDNRPLKEVLDEIAKVTTSQWFSNANGGFKLVRPASLIQLAEESELQKRLTQIKDWHSREIRTSFADQPLSGDLESGFVSATKKQIKAKSGARSTSPARFLETALLVPFYLECRKRIDLKTVAKLREDQRAVFSSCPNARQIGFTQTIAPLIDQLNKKLGSWRRSLERAGIRKVSVPVDPKTYESRSIFPDSSNETLPFAHPITTAVLSFNATIYDSILVTISLLDERGRVVAAKLCDQILTATSPRSPAVDLPGIESALPLAPTIQTRALIRASSDDRENDSSYLTDQEITESLRPYFNDPTNYDFLKLGNQEFLSMLGPSTKRSIVACIPDGQVLNWEEKSLKRFVEAGIGDATASTISENWIDFFPRNPADHWRTRGSREALARCAKYWNEKRSMPMRDVVQLFPGGDIGYPNVLEFAQLIMPAGRYRHYNSQAAFSNYRGMGNLLGSLSDAQVRQLLNGSMIRYRDLSKDQRGYCESIVYGVPFHRVIGGNTNSWEPTIELPNGLVENLGITAQYIDDKYLLAHDPEEPSSFDIRETMDLDKRAERFNGFGLRCGNYARANRWMKFDFRTRRRFALRCYLTKDHYYSVDYYEPMSPDKGQRLTVDQLQPSLVARIVKENLSFNSRPIKYIKDGMTYVRWEKYIEPTKKKKK